MILDNGPIYLDNHATTRVDPDVVESMLPWFTDNYGNAGSGTHAMGVEARDAVEAARKQVAQERKNNKNGNQKPKAGTSKQTVRPAVEKRMMMRDQGVKGKDARLHEPR